MLLCLMLLLRKVLYRHIRLVAALCEDWYSFERRLVRLVNA